MLPRPEAEPLPTFLAARADELERRSGGRFPLSQPDRGVLPEDLSPCTEPRYAVGDDVRVREWHPPGHTRAPRYVQGRRGTVVRVDGAFDIDDIAAHGGGSVADPLYSVRFTSRELRFAATMAALVLAGIAFGAVHLSFHDRGSHELKGVPGEWRVYAAARDVATRG